MKQGQAEQVTPPKTVAVAPSAIELRPVLNVAGHYEWPVLIRTDAAAAWPYGPDPGVAVWLGSDPPGPPDPPDPAAGPAEPSVAGAWWQARTSGRA
jgi:hypothetical protein